MSDSATLYVTMASALLTLAGAIAFVLKKRLFKCSFFCLKSDCTKRNDSPDTPLETVITEPLAPPPSPRLAPPVQRPRGNSGGRALPVPPA